MKSQTKRALACSLGLLASAGAIAYAATTSANSQAQAVVNAIEAKPEQKQLTAEQLAKAHAALKRAADARASGDEQHAALLDELALEWANAGSDLVRSADIEKQAAAAEKEAAELEAKAVRALAIIEEAVARKGRAEHELQQQTSKAASDEANEESSQ